MLSTSLRRLCTPASSMRLAFFRPVSAARFSTTANNDTYIKKLIDDDGKEIEFKIKNDPNDPISDIKIEEDCIVATINGEDVWVPDIARTIEWALPTPVDVHLFDETPVIKECPGN